MPKISSIDGRIIFNSRGTKTIEIDVISDGKFLGRVGAPSGASVGKYEAVSFPDKSPEKSLQILKENSYINCLKYKNAASVIPHNPKTTGNIEKPICMAE